MSDIQIQIKTSDADSAVVIQRVTDSLKKLGVETKTTSDNSQKLSTALPAMSSGLSDTAMTAVKAGAAFAGVALSIKGVWTAAESAAQKQEIKQGFVELTRSVGLSADEIIVKMRKASAETVSNGETMKAVSKTLTLGIVANADEMAKLLEIARSKSRGLNQSTIETYDQLVNAINTGTQKALKGLGIDLPEAIEKSTLKMGDAEKKAAILGAVLEQEGAKIDKLGGVHDTAADKFRRFDVAVGSIKASFVSLALHITPVVELVADLTAKMAAFINVRDQYAAMSLKDLQAAKADAEKLLNGEIALNEAQAAERARFSNMRSDDPDFTGGGGMYITSQRETELKNTLKAIDDHITARGELEKSRAKYLQTVNAGITADRLAAKETKDSTKATKEQKETVEALSKSMEKAYKAAKDFAQSDELKKLEIILLDLADNAESFVTALGVDKLAPVRGMLTDLAATAGLLAGNLQGIDPAKWASSHAQTTIDKAANWFTTGTKDTFSGITGFADTFITAIGNAEPAKTENTLRAVLEKPLAQVFNDAMVSGLEEGNFFQSLGAGLRRVVNQNISDAVTVAVFGGGSSASAGINGVSSSGSGGSSTSSGGFGGLLSGISNGGDIWANGKLQTGNLTQMLGTNLALSFVTNRLFGAGGVFGSRVIHGAESIQQSADVNTQVTQSQDLRNELLKAVGIDEETRQALADAKFYYTWYSKHKSGNGFTSKKTTTYALEGSGAAYDSINAIKLLQEQATGEQSYRAYDLTKLARMGGTKALQESLNDINAVVSRLYDLKPGSTTDYLYSATDRAQLLTQQMQAQSQLGTAIGAGQNNAASFLFGNTLAAGRNSNLLQIALGNQSIPTDGAMIGSMLPLLKTTASQSFEMEREASLAGSDPVKLAAILTKQKTALDAAMGTYKTIMDDAEAEASSTTLSIEEKRAAFDRFQQAQTAYYTAKQQALDVELQQQQAVKDKQAKLRDDQLSSLLSFAGEVGGRNGDTYNILGSAQTETLLQQLKAANAGKNPELNQLLDAMLAQSQKKTKWG